MVDGAASVLVWVSSETILVARAKREIKAFVTSIYGMSIAVGYGVGSLAAFLAAKILPNERVFLVAGAISVLTGLFVLLRLDRNADAHRQDAEAQAEGAPGELAPLGALINRIKPSCFATFAYGYFQSSVVLFLPCATHAHPRSTPAATISGYSPHASELSAAVTGIAKRSKASTSRQIPTRGP